MAWFANWEELILVEHGRAVSDEEAEEKLFGRSPRAGRVKAELAWLDNEV